MRNRLVWMRRAAVGVLIAAASFVGVSVWGPSLGCTPFRSLKTHIAERKTFDAPTTAPFAAAEDWPAWRGPRGDGISHETDLAESWPADGLKPVWSAEVGLGYSSPIAVGGRVYQFSLNEKREALTCFDARTGHILWNDETPTGWTSNFPGTRSTPAVDGNSVYTYGGAGDLVCRDLATGKPRWQVNVLQTTDSKNLGYGSASSPLVAMGKVFVQSGQGGAVAVAADKETGKIAWQSEARGVAGYAHPILADVSGTPQLVVFAGDTLYGMDPQTGRTIWSVPWDTSYNVNSTTPTYSPTDGHLFITSSYGMGCMMLQLSPTGAKKVWTNKEVKSKFQQTILDNGFLYANSAGRLKCLTWPDGTRKWEATPDDGVTLGENGSIVRAGDKLIVMSDSGQLSLLRAGPEGFKVLATSKAFDHDELWATPLLYGGRLYAKGTRELTCFDVSNGQK